MAARREGPGEPRAGARISPGHDRHVEQPVVGDRVGRDPDDVGVPARVRDHDLGGGALPGVDAVHPHAPPEGPIGRDRAERAERDADGAQASLEPRVGALEGEPVDPEPGHQHEAQPAAVRRGQPAEVHRAVLAGHDRPRGRLRRPRRVELVSPQVRRASRQNRQRHGAAGEGRRDVAQRPVAACGDEQAAARVESVAHLLPGPALTTAMHHVHVPAGCPEDREDAFHWVGSAVRAGVVDDPGAHVSYLRSALHERPTGESSATLASSAWAAAAWVTT